MLYLLFSAFIVNIFLTLILFSVFCYSNLSAKLIFLSFFKLNIYTYIFTHSTTLALTKILTLQYIHYHSVILFSILITISSFYVKVTYKSEFTSTSFVLWLFLSNVFILNINFIFFILNIKIAFWSRMCS